MAALLRAEAWPGPLSSWTQPRALGMAYHIPNEETLDREGLSALQRAKLAALLTEVYKSNPFYGRKLRGVAFDPLADPLDRLPFTTRDEIQQDQLEHPPYGTNLTYPRQRFGRIHQTSGSTGVPLRWLDTAESWAWFRRCWAIIYRAAGVTPRDRVFFPFSFGPFIGFWSAFDCAAELGNLCLPGGGMTTAARVQFMLENDTTVVCCTPTYALRMAEVAEQHGLNLAKSSVRALIVAGEPGGSIPATRAGLENAWGARVFDHTGMTEIGPCGFECVEAPGAVHLIESEFIVEVIDPSTAQPVADGDPGELVLTNLGRWGSPLIRYRTGDQVRLVRSRCACGRWFARLDGGILGRLDDMLIIRGHNVFPAAVEGVVRRFPEVAEFRLVVDHAGVLADLRIDVEARAGADVVGLGERIAEAVRDRLHFRPRVVPVDAGTLPRYEMKAQRVVRP